MTYDKRNQEAINKLPIEMLWKVTLLLELLAEIGENVLITSGKRTEKEQNELYAQGRTKPGQKVTWVKGLDSNHVHGLAIDIVPVGPLGIQFSKQYKLEWAAGKRYQRIAAIAKTIGFEWGYDLWETDKPHLQYTQGLTIEQLKKGQNLDSERAKEEVASYYRSRLENAERALKFHSDDSRKVRLTAYINRLERKLSRME